MQRGEGDTAAGLDRVVVGSGSGGSVSALRVAEKGYRVTVLEHHPRGRARRRHVGTDQLLADAEHRSTPHTQRRQQR